jgi:peptide/nickel transport system substrate-binding protein
MTSAEEGIGGKYVKNPEYWKSGLPYLDGIETRYIADPKAAYAAFIGSLDILSPLSGSDAKDYMGRQGSGYTPDYAGWEGLRGVPQPYTKRPPFNDARMTKALRLLTDHQEIMTTFTEVDAVRGGYGSIFPTSLDGWDLSQEEYKNHLEWKQPKDEATREGIRLLNAAGYNQTNRLKIRLVNLTSFSTLGQLLQDQWKRLSGNVIETELSNHDLNVFYGIRNNRDFDVLVNSHAAGISEADVWLNTFTTTKGGQNVMDHSDATLDAMVAKEGQEFDLQKRKGLVKDILKYWLENGPYTTTNKGYVLSARKPQVRNHVSETGMIGKQFESVWLDKA